MKNLVWLLFLPDFFCNPDPLTIDPGSLFTWKGSCVLIPCQIGRYMGSDLRDISLFWYFRPFYDTNQTDYSGHLLYNSSSHSRSYRSKLQSASGSQLEFVGNLGEKNCSLKISKARTEDSGMYGARMLAAYSKPVQRNRWFLNATVNVAESPPVPKMDISPKVLREGGMTVTCSIPYHCPEEPLRLTITGLGGISTFSQITTKNGLSQTVVSFQVTWKDHQKSLVCTLRTQSRSEISKNRIELDVQYGPKDVQVKASPGKVIREGETLSLECTIESANPEVSEYLWYKDGLLMSEWLKHEKIEFVTEGDRHSGAYKCEAKNSVTSEMSKELTIEVQYPPKEVKIERWPSGNIKEGEKMELMCSSKGNPQISEYKWYKRPQTNVFHTGERLPFNPVQLKNAGTYYCTANNSLGQSESSPVTLDVLYAPKDVQLVIENDQRPIMEEDTVRLNCSFGHSNPHDSIWYKWYKGESELPDQGNLLIFPAKLEKAGDYTCKVCNTVRCVPAQRVIVDIHYAPKGVTVVQEPSNPVHEGSHVNLKCEVEKANPKIDSYRWYKDGVQQHLDSALDKLTIYHVTSRNSGTYWCEATNSVTTSLSKQVMLNVYYAPRNVHLSVEGQVEVIEGMDVSLLCAADANPPPHFFVLYRDEEKLIERYDQILLLRKVQVKDSGDYHCRAYNKLSSSESQTLILSVSYSKATKLKHGMKGLGIILSFIFVLGMLIFAVKAWKKKRGPEASGTKRSGSFFVRKPKPEQLCNNRAPEGAANSLAFLNEGAEEPVSYAMLRFPPRVSEEQDDYARVNAPRVALNPSNEEVVYSVVKKPGVLSKGDTKHDYENVVVPKEEELHYSSLVNLAPRPRPTYRDSETDSESEDSIQYAALKH